MENQTRRNSLSVARGDILSKSDFCPPARHQHPGDLVILPNIVIKTRPHPRCRLLQQGISLNSELVPVACWLIVRIIGLLWTLYGPNRFESNAESHGLCEILWLHINIIVPDQGEPNAL